MSSVAATDTGSVAANIAALTKKKPLTVGRIVLQVFLVTMSLTWLVPILGAVVSAFRNDGELRQNGVISIPRSFTTSNFSAAFNKGGMARAFFNTAIILVPSICLILLFASLVGFACTQFSGRFNTLFLVIFTAGNLMPQQVIFQPIVQIFKNKLLPVPDVIASIFFDEKNGVLLGTKIGVILIHVAFQTGFCTFVLSNYMRTLPKELTEAALVDGASVSRQFWGIILPLSKPALAALGTLEFTWLYNDFFWGSVMLNQGKQKPITSSIAQLSGAFTTSDAQVAAASVIIAIPTLVVYFLLQKQFIGGLTLGATKG
jgi:multiple sugar transport system permease protein